MSAFTYVLRKTWPQLLEWRRRGIFAIWMNAESPDLCVLSVLVDGSNPAWDERIMLVGTEEFLAARFDLEKLPPGSIFLKGQAAREFIREAEREEANYRRDQAFKRKFGGEN
jgi:hypothetical protein